MFIFVFIFKSVLYYIGGIFYEIGFNKIIYNLLRIIELELWEKIYMEVKF